MREAAFESRRSCVKPLAITIPPLFQIPLSFFRLVFNSLSAMCKCDSVLRSAVFKCAGTCEASRIYAMCTIIISDNYLVFLEPHALSVLKARTELYARRDVRSILSHMVRSYQLLLDCPTRRGNRDPLPTRFISRMLYIFFPFSLTMMRDLNCYSNSTSTQS